jgi:hypothetical protein
MDIHRSQASYKANFFFKSQHKAKISMKKRGGIKNWVAALP